MKTGICSITFRQLDVAQIVELVQQAGLDAIEWGGDVHVPPGNVDAAQTALRLTREAGLEVSSYGSYYKVLDADGNPEDFAPVLESALVLETDTIRIWPGARASESAGDEYRRAFAEKVRANLDLAQQHGLRLALEFHANSLTDSGAAAWELLQEINHPNLYVYWQPMYWVADTEYRFQTLETLKSRVLNLHVFHWRFHPYRGGWGENTERCALQEGAEEWRRYLSVDLPPGEHFALLEFVKDDSVEQFLADAAVLKEWLV